MVLDVVMMGNAELWKVKREKDTIYANLEATEEDYMRAAELEIQFGELDGYTAESRAGELLIGVGIPVELHTGQMKEVAPGFKLRVLLAQALFSDPDILLLDEPTNNLDINTIRWLEDVINARASTMVIISHDRHFLNSVCTHMADLDFGEIRIYPGNYDEYMVASTQARQRMLTDNAKKKEQVARIAGLRRPLFRQCLQGAPGNQPRPASRQNQVGHCRCQTLQPPESLHPFRNRRPGKASPPGGGAAGCRQRLRQGAVPRPQLCFSTLASASPSSDPTAPANPPC